MNFRYESKEKINTNPERLSRISFKPKIDQSIYLDASSSTHGNKKIEELISVETSIPVTNRMNSIFKIKNVDLNKAYQDKPSFRKMPEDSAKKSSRMNSQHINLIENNLMMKG